MNLMWRLLWTMIFSRYTSKVNIFSECSTYFRVLPTDIDVFRHMNNARYFSLMDVARVDFLIRSGYYYQLSKKKIYPVVASEMIRFKKSLKLFQHFQLTSRLLGWNDKFFFIEHCFKRKNQTYAQGIIKSCFLRKSGGAMDSHSIAKIMNINPASPPLPNWVLAWQDAEQAFTSETIKNKEKILQRILAE